MQLTWIKGLWIAVNAISIVALVLFLLGATAGLQRWIDLVYTVLAIYLWLPSLLLTSLSIYLLSKGLIPTKLITCIILFIFLSCILFLSALLVKNVNTAGWITEIVRTDPLKLTQDEEYEYQLELVNLFQRNSKARLYVKSVETAEVKRIPIAIRTKDIEVIFSGKDTHWVKLEPSGESDLYILNTTKRLTEPEETFEVNIKKGTSRRLE